MGNTVVGVLVGVGMLVVMGMTADMVRMMMHNAFSFSFFFYYSGKRG